MKVLDISEHNDREIWLDWRRDKIGGDDSSKIKPLSRGVMKGAVEGAAGFWHFVAGMFAIAKDGEKDIDRGHRLEPENLHRTNEKYSLDMQKVGVWLSDYSDYIHITPDGAQVGDKPKHAFEGKAFDTNKHLSIIYFDLKAQEENSYNPLLSLPKDNQDQAIKYFAVADSLEVLHWSMINEMVVHDELTHYVIDIKREHVANLIDEQKQTELAAVIKRDEVMDYMLKKVNKK